MTDDYEHSMTDDYDEHHYRRDSIALGRLEGQAWTAEDLAYA